MRPHNDRPGFDWLYLAVAVLGVLVARYALHGPLPPLPWSP